MSKVFDTLSRAINPAPQNSAANKEWTLLDEVHADAAPHAGLNGKAAAAVPARDDPNPRSWSERLEKFLFGWGLTGYKPYPIAAFEKDSRESEQYKILREKLKRLAHERKAHCFCVTSPVKGDGKSLVAVNLAVSIALTLEQRVLLIDGDLRAPQVHHYFNVHSIPGLTEYLSNNSARETLAGYLHDTFLPNLQILPAGSPTEFSSELLCSAKMRSLMAELRSTYRDYQIIFDTSPILTTPDPLVLARQVDGTLMVARVGKTPHECLLESYQHLDPGKVIGLVLNDCEPTAGGKYYYRYGKS
jgi:capsular exopolysaccharide synthesis family protein